MPEQPPDPAPSGLIESDGPDSTGAIAGRLAGTLAPGDLVLIRGELGAGKTTFVRGACRALGVGEPVTSPTFTIGQVYSGERDGARLRIAHLDLYRLGSLDDEDPGLLDDYLGPETISFVEWPGVAARELGAPAMRVSIEHAGGDSRRIEVAR